MRRGFCLLLAAAILLSACSKKVDAPVIPTAPSIPPTSTPNPLPTATPFAQIFPTNNPDLLVFSVHVEIVRVSNDDGSEMANVSPDDVIKQLDFANELLASSSIRFVFDPQTDVDIVQSTLIANMLTPENTDWQAGMEAADQVAVKHSGKVTILVRTKPIEEPSHAAGFLWWDYNFALVSLGQTEECGQPDYSTILHALGHYLGLGNTYTEAYKDVDSAASAYEDSGYNLSSFDGDGLTDTPADLFIDQQEFICNNAVSFNLGGSEIPVTRGNVMSGYYPRESFTPEQIARMRYLLALRQRLGMIMPTNRGIKNPIEMESATIYMASWLTTEVKDLTPFSLRNFSDGKALCAYAGYGSRLYITFSVPTTAIYEMNLYAVQSPDGGILEANVDDVLVNDYINLYGPYIYASGKIGMGPYYLEEGEHQIYFEVIKTDPLSTGFNFCLDAMTIEMKPQ
jgi:hypothetical protein